MDNSLVIIIKSTPYGSENPLGALFIALSTADAGVPVSVFFADDGLYCLLKDQNAHREVAMPAISDLIMSFVGKAKFYYLLSPSHPFTPSVSELVNQKQFPVNGVKKGSFEQLIDLILNQLCPIMIL
jgi:predicted peroxiredoxin